MTRLRRYISWIKELWPLDSVVYRRSIKREYQFGQWFRALMHWHILCQKFLADKQILYNVRDDFKTFIFTFHIFLHVPSYFSYIFLLISFIFLHKKFLRENFRPDVYRFFLRGGICIAYFTFTPKVECYMKHVHEWYFC